MLEVEVHLEFKKFLRQKPHWDWIHNLTMARIVARGIRLRKSTIIQTGVNYLQYYPSYLTPVLLSSVSVVIVVKKEIQSILVKEKIPFLQQWLNTTKIVTTEYQQNLAKKSILYVISYDDWLNLVINNLFDNDIITIIDEAENLPDIITQYLTQEITFQDWYSLQLLFPQYQNIIRENLAKLTKSIYSHPKNPDNSYLLEEEEIIIIDNLYNVFHQQIENSEICQKFINLKLFLAQNDKYINYFTTHREKGSFSLKSSPLELKSLISNIWQNKSLILLSNYLEQNKYPVDYCEYLGLKLDTFTCLKFSFDIQSQHLKLYIPHNFPFPNNPEFQSRVTQEILALVSSIKINHHPIIVIIDDVPLQGQITSNLAAYFGSRVQLNSLNIGKNSILVCDIKFWLNYQSQLLTPILLIFATLPIPPLENPLISAQVTHYKNQKKDWFRFYLLPSAIKLLQQATISIRKNQGVIALLDNRVNYRSYGVNILQSLEPYAKINYLDLDWVNHS
ncbi:MAG: DNA helicase [Cyanobacteria bacterium]|nr:DNA helicase [Cyanobacteria bacterium CG_2015-16_32_12]NCO78170.1 DNA helicase [Cyanobacteria bacterium CG_2015-22_32_23]NCQ04609.1 DNA helicase [Cyanobacteria bacterium CG_2015-09_32_10]NCQ43140.1 DNA helicase [Cyanobacteria bacterium CG_2015-04_32_10]NCS84161.1 DNA helicase [Cyanobacteria bacterium CG_2015-02_32_10]